MVKPIGYLRKQRDRRNRSAFASLISSPAEGAFTMPAAGHFSFQSEAGCESGTQCGTIGDRAVYAPELAADGRTNLHYAERGVTVTPASGFTVGLDIGLGRVATIGSAGGGGGDLNPQPDFDAEPAGAELNGVEIVGGKAVAAVDTGPLVIPAATSVIAGAYDLNFAVSALESGLGSYVKVVAGGQPMWISYEPETTMIPVWLGGIENQDIELWFWNMGETSIEVETFSMVRWGPVPDLLPVTLDFKNADYQTAFGGMHPFQVLGAPEGFVFNPSTSITTGVGLVQHSPCVNAAIVEQMDAPGAGFTVVAYLNAVGEDGPFDVSVLTIQLASESGSLYRALLVYMPSSDMIGADAGFDLNDNGGQVISDHDASFNGLGPRRIAFSMSAEGVSVSYCGRPVVVAEAGDFTGEIPDEAWHLFAIMPAPGGVITPVVEKFEIMAKVNDSELPALSTVPGPVELYPQPLFADDVGLTLNGWQFAPGNVQSVGSGGAPLVTQAVQTCGPGTYRATYSGNGGSVPVRIVVFGVVHDFTAGPLVDVVHDFEVTVPANQNIELVDFFDNESVSFTAFSLVQIA